MTTAQQGAERAGELAALREAVGDLIAGSGGIAAARLRLEAEPGYDEQAWRLLGADMGLAGLGIAEDLGGVGGGLAELTVVAEELGRSLLPVPFFSSTVLAGQILSRCPDTAGDVLARLSAGTELAAFAGTDADGCWRPERLPVEAKAEESTWRLRGTAQFVLDGANAAHLVVAARTPSGCDLFLVGGDSEGVQRRGLETLDPTRGQASVSFDGAGGRPLTTGGGGAGAVEAALNVALVVLAAEQVGGAAACLDMAVEYAKIRHQFSRPIGSFQAIKQSSLTCCYWSRWAVRPLTARYWSSRTRRGWLKPRRSRRSGAATRSPRSRRRTSTSTGGSGSPGSMTRTCTSAARGQTRDCSATRRCTGNGWRRC